MILETRTLVTGQVSRIMITAPKHSSIISDKNTGASGMTEIAVTKDSNRVANVNNVPKSIRAVIKLTGSVFVEVTRPGYPTFVKTKVTKATGVSVISVATASGILTSIITTETPDRWAAIITTVSDQEETAVTSPLRPK